MPRFEGSRTTPQAGRAPCTAKIHATGGRENGAARKSEIALPPDLAIDAEVEDTAA